MFQHHRTQLTERTHRIQLYQEEQALAYAQVITLWETSQTFRTFYNQLLAQLPFAGFFWENKPITPQTLQAPYEFVVVGTAAFDGLNANSKPFSKYFEKDEWVVRFDNLGKNANLVVPCPSDLYDSGYTHLGIFVRQAPPAQRDAFWERVGKAVQARIESDKQPFWLSTSGLGVHWLHVRLDQRPKYYIHKAYKTATER
jgi:hypothetical protein